MVNQFHLAATTCDHTVRVLLLIVLIRLYVVIWVVKEFLRWSQRPRRHFCHVVTRHHCSVRSPPLTLVLVHVRLLDDLFVFVKHALQDDIALSILDVLLETLIHTAICIDRCRLRMEMIRLLSLLSGVKQNWPLSCHILLILSLLSQVLLVHNLVVVTALYFLLFLFLLL